MWSIPWMIADIVQNIKEFFNMRTHKFQHILREGNQLADYLTNRVIFTNFDKGNVIFTNFESLDSQARWIINSDKLQSLYIRVSPYFLQLKMEG